MCRNPINPYGEANGALTRGRGTGCTLCATGADLPPSSPAGPWAPAWFSQGFRCCHSDLWEHPPLCFAFLYPSYPPCRTSCRRWPRRRATAWWSARWWCRAVWKCFPSAVELSLGAAWPCSWAPLPGSRRSARAIMSRGSWRRRWGVLPGRCTSSHRPAGRSLVDSSRARTNTTVRTRGKTWRRLPSWKVEGEVEKAKH